MLSGFLGKKIGMTQIYTDDGCLLPITLIQAGPCSVMQIKTIENDGYSAIKLGFDDKKKKNATKQEIGGAAKVSQEPKRFIREVKPDASADIKLGQSITVDIFADVKQGGAQTHGSTRHRPPGSIGSNTDPGRVIRGKKMAGRLGVERITVKNIDVVKIDKDRNLLFVRGAVPGHKGSYLILNKSRVKG